MKPWITDLAIGSSIINENIKGVLMKSNRKLFGLSLAVAILLIGYFLVYIKPDHYTEGYPCLVQKNYEENHYFIYVENDFANHSLTKLECTQQQYDKVVISEKLQYHIAYEFNSHSPQKGKLTSLDFNNTIDNRSVN